MVRNPLIIFRKIEPNKNGCDRNRTCDLLVKSQLLCLLSYTSDLNGPGGIEPPTP